MEDVSLHLLDIMANAIKAKASLIEIIIDLRLSQDQLEILVQDNGEGISEALVKQRAETVFSSLIGKDKKRKSGLGLAWFKESCEKTGGFLHIVSEVDRGTNVTGMYCLSHPARVPLGKLGQAFASMVISYPTKDFSLAFRQEGNLMWQLQTKDLRSRLEEVPLDNFDVYVFIRDYIDQQQQDVLGGI